MAVWPRGPCEAKDGRGVEDDGHAVWDDGMVCDHAFGFEVSHHTRDGIRHAVAEVNARIAKADAGERCGEDHLRAGFVVIGVANRAGQVLRGHFYGFECPHVGNGVGALIGGAFDWAIGSGAFGIGDSGEGFEGVAQDVETGCGPR